jgi:hypothetical protein
MSNGALGSIRCYTCVPSASTIAVFAPQDELARFPYDSMAFKDRGTLFLLYAY